MKSFIKTVILTIFFFGTSSVHAEETILPELGQAQEIAAEADKVYTAFLRVYKLLEPQMENEMKRGLSKPGDMLQTVLLVSATIVHDYLHDATSSLTELSANASERTDSICENKMVSMLTCLEALQEAEGIFRFLQLFASARAELSVTIQMIDEGKLVY